MSHIFLNRKSEPKLLLSIYLTSTHWRCIRSDSRQTCRLYCNSFQCWKSKTSSMIDWRLVVFLDWAQHRKCIHHWIIAQKSLEFLNSSIDIAITQMMPIMSVNEQALHCILIAILRQTTPLWVRPSVKRKVIDMRCDMRYALSPKNSDYWRLVQWLDYRSAVVSQLRTNQTIANNFNRCMSQTQRWSKGSNLTSDK